MLTKVKYILLENPNDKFGKVIKEEEFDASLNYENEIPLDVIIEGRTYRVKRKEITRYVPYETNEKIQKIYIKVI